MHPLNHVASQAQDTTTFKYLVNINEASSSFVSTCRDLSHYFIPFV